VGLLNEQMSKERLAENPSLNRHHGDHSAQSEESFIPPLDYISYDFLTNMKRSDNKSKQVRRASIIGHYKVSCTTLQFIEMNEIHMIGRSLKP